MRKDATAFRFVVVQTTGDEYVYNTWSCTEAELKTEEVDAAIEYMQMDDHYESHRAEWLVPDEGWLDYYELQGLDHD